MLFVGSGRSCGVCELTIVLMVSRSEHCMKLWKLICKGVVLYIKLYLVLLSLQARSGGAWFVSRVPDVCLLVPSPEGLIVHRSASVDVWLAVLRHIERIPYRVVVLW